MLEVLVVALVLYGIIQAIWAVWSRSALEGIFLWLVWWTLAIPLLSRAMRRLGMYYFANRERLGWFRS